MLTSTKIVDGDTVKVYYLVDPVGSGALHRSRARFNFLQFHIKSETKPLKESVDIQYIGICRTSCHPTIIVQCAACVCQSQKMSRNKNSKQTRKRTTSQTDMTHKKPRKPKRPCIVTVKQRLSHPFYAFPTKHRPTTRCP